MKKLGTFLLLVLILVKNVELKLFVDESEKILIDLISYNSVKIKQNHEKVHDYSPETVYYSPYQTLEKNENFTKNMEKLGNAVKKKITKRSSDTTFRGKPKTIEVKRISGKYFELNKLLFPGSVASKFQLCDSRVRSVVVSH